MRTSFLAVVAILCLLFGAKAYANHENIPILEGIVPIGEGTCSFNHKGEMMKGGAISKPCTLVHKPPDKYYAVVFGKDEAIIEVVEMNLETGKNKSVWKLGLKI